MTSPQKRNWETIMFPALFNGYLSTRRAVSLKWLRGIMVLGMAFSVSACAYDGGYHAAHGGYYGGYQNGYQGGYQHGHHGGYYHGYQHGYQAPLYNHHGRYSRLNEAQRRRDAEIYRHHFESQRRFEKRLHEAHKHPRAHRGHPHVHKQRSRNAGARRHHQGQHSQRPQHRHR